MLAILALLSFGTAAVMAAIQRAWPMACLAIGFLLIHLPTFL
jgi:hypothetical protein